MDPIAAGTVIAAAGAALAALFLAGSRRRVNEANVVESLTTAAVTLVAPLQQEGKELRERIAAQEAGDKARNEAIAELRQQNAECLAREAALNARIEGLER